ncbi:collagen alpha-4(vi) chain [Plakobranchus ocellatus]|uniref:Collagen alpha-4(Vi) chain n=1 Tax=Plakobranchus ocellatus TaxID=259542 RepID=A0AAV4A513_9GAST|nr:collagen alpha-4(vi) chain [Plakobranchus ocellatus]
MKLKTARKVMANYLIMPNGKNNQDLTPGSPKLGLSVRPTLLYTDKPKLMSHCFLVTLLGCDQPLDVVVMVDVSFYGKAAAFQQLQRALLKLVDDMELGENIVRMGFLTFSDTVYDVIDLGWDAHRLMSHIRTLSWQRHGSNFGAAISRMTQMFAARGRHGIPHTAILITEGHSQHPHASKMAAKLARAAGIRLVSVGIGALISDTELMDVVEDFADFFNVDSLGHLAILLLQINRHICPPCPTGEPTKAINKRSHAQQMSLPREMPVFRQAIVVPTTRPPPPKVTTTRNPNDIAIVVDGSSNVSNQQFDVIKTAIENLIDNNDVSPTGVNIGVVTFSDKVGDVIDLTGNPTSLKNQVAGLTLPGGGTNVSVGIDTMIDMFNRLGRPNVPRVSVVITESKSANPQQTAASATRARQAGVQMLAVGVGVQTSVQELIGVAGRSNVANVFTLEEYKDLSSVLLNINRGFCSE